MSDPEAICQCLSARFYRLLDERDYEGLAGLFAPDGVWHRQGKALMGAGQILAAMNRRSDTVHIRHVLTATDVHTTQMPDTLDVIGYVLVFRQVVNGELRLPLPMPQAPSTLMSIRDRYTCVDGEWKLLEKSSERIFVAE